MSATVSREKCEALGCALVILVVRVRWRLLLEAHTPVLAPRTCRERDLSAY